MEQKMNILLADADDEIRGLECDYLQVKDCVVMAVATAQSIIDAVQQQKPDVCILSDKLQDMPVVSVVQNLRETGLDIPILVYGEAPTKEGMIAAYRAGIDAYLTKPFPMEVLLQQVCALRRLYRVGMPKREGCFDFGGVYFDANRHTIGGEKISTLEARILALLCQNRNQLVERDTILQTAWPEADSRGQHILPIYIHRLRQHLEIAPAVDIASVHGKGYKLVDVVL